jgi:predicted acyltransferase
MDRILMGKINPGGGWVAINVIGSSAHTMWGVIAGLVLKSDAPHMKKVKQIALAGLAALVIGYALDPVTPIIKRICTSSFIFASGGYALIALAFFYWLVDVRGYKKWTKFAVIVGMNSIFIYMFANLLGGWANEFVGVFDKPFIEPLGLAGKILHQNIVLVFYWIMLWWMYRRKIFIGYKRRSRFIIK